MINLRFSDAVHKSGFQHRANLLPDGSVVYRLADGSGSVALPRARWEAIGEAFTLEIAPFRKRTNRMMWLLFPAIFVLAMTVGQIFPYTGILILLGIFGAPLAIYLWYSAKVAQAAKTAEVRLKKFPQTPPVKAPVGKIPRVIQIASLILVGPYLIIAIIGEIGGPQTFRNTPFTGANIGWLEMIAMGLIAFQLLWPVLAPKLLRF
jgi:hypothetical protein